MLHAVGFTTDDFKKSQVGIASTWSMVTPCNMHIDVLAREAAAGVDAAGGKAVIFNTITISDGISMGTEGMKYSLASREVIADSIEAVMGCQGFDGLVAIGGCDKNMPGCMMAIARLNRPPSSSTAAPSCPAATSGKGGHRLGLRGGGRACRGAIDDKELKEIERNAPSPVPVPAAACTPPTPWPRPSRRWA
jgi:dihydroxy-acid dehydratase